MPFDVKNWENAPSVATPISASALEDLETRLSGYTDTSLTVEDPHVIGDPGVIGFAQLPPLESFDTHAVGDGGEPAYENSWTGNAEFGVSNLGNARIQGAVTNAGSSATVFTLPAGFRPASQQVFSNFTVETNGTVVPTGSQTDIDFSAENGGNSAVFAADGATIAPDIDVLVQSAVPIRFYKDPLGIVHLAGGATWNSIATNLTQVDLFVLPSGYEPDGELFIPTGIWDFDGETFDPSTGVTIYVEANGTVSVKGSSISPGNMNYGPVLDNLSFRAA